MTKTEEQLLQLLRAALLNKPVDADMFKGAAWLSIFRLADVQKVQAIALDGAGLLPADCLAIIPQGEKLKRVKQVIQTERTNRLHRSVIVKIDTALKAEGIKAVFMKGQTTALRYPNPLHRVPGDIDFVVAPKDFERTMAVMEKLGEVDHSLVHEHHGMAWIDGVTIEPHYKVHNYQCPSTDKAMAEIFASIYPDGLASTEIDGHEISVFPPTLESVFLISHKVNHIYEEGLGLRQVIDYAMFLSKCASDIDWQQHADYLQRMKMMRAWRIFTCICAEYFGVAIPSTVEPFTPKEKRWAERLMTDIMAVGNFGRGQYVFKHNGIADAFRNYCWVAKRCLRLGFVCPSEARWWMISKVTRFFWKKAKEKGQNT